jgi:hypothetical protein
MEPGWQRNVVVTIILAVSAVGYGLLSLDEGRSFAEGFGEGLWLSASLLAVIVAEGLIRSPRARFVVLAASLVAISAAYQLIADGGATWTAAAWAVGAAAGVIVLERIFAAVSRRLPGGRRPTAT